MNYNLTSILQQLSAIHFKEIEGEFTTHELWEWMLFDKENSILNKSLQIHQPSGVPINGRVTELNKNLSITGNYYCFTYIAHQPAYHLHKVNSVDELANLILAKSGVTNWFTTIIIPIVKGKIGTILKKQKFTATETCLINEIQEIITSLDNFNFNKLTKQGHFCLLKYKNLGISQQNMYNTIHFISQIYQRLNIDNKQDLADEFLDYISGYIGDKKCWIWDKPL
ncbi:MAG: hypothetical protein HRT69_18105 [Flavobacteriaceae bacterium]|nr:hypothetical protein [Flavobacteriaceae bacterium]